MKIKTLSQLNAMDAAKILGLPEHDPVIALYQGIEYFERNDSQNALINLLIAAEHYQLHAIPYLQELQKLKTLTIDQTCQEKLLAMNVWVNWLSAAQVGHKNFHGASKSVMSLRKLQDKKPVNSKTKAGKSRAVTEMKRFLKEEALSAHMSYHQALISTKPEEVTRHLTNAANYGHLLAIAYFAQGNIPHNTINVYAKSLIDIQQNDPTKTFAERICHRVLASQEPIGKKSFHFEAVRLGVNRAFSMIAGLYFIAHNEFEAALPLVAIAVQRNEP
ncbi:MAG: hypothetical protein M3R00_03435, partial [Pseudomonadota bacterium]|nr:hypothetical protein [Pseudomonadota bacterium]